LREREGDVEEDELLRPCRGGRQADRRQQHRHTKPRTPSFVSHRNLQKGRVTISLMTDGHLRAQTGFYSPHCTKLHQIAGFSRTLRGVRGPSPPRARVLPAEPDDL